MTTRRFDIAIPQPVLDDLRSRLARTRITRIPGAKGWSLGTDPNYLSELIAYWLNTFDWRAQERRLNSFPNYVAGIDGANLHFVHERASVVAGMPLLLLHGWPDSFIRYAKVLPELRKSRDVVVPSLPGFAFTGQVNRPRGMPLNKHTARLLFNLMTEELGYPRFAVSGGDGGSALAQILAIEYPEHVAAIHLTDIGWHAVNEKLPDLDRDERRYLERSKRRFMEDGAYAAVHMTTPRTLEAALLDSPAGLASWILDRFHSWSDNSGDLEKSFSRDDLITNITIYWVTRTIGSSILGYLEETRQPSLTPEDYVDAPVGLSLFPKDMGGPPPDSLADRTLNVAHRKELPRGSHFTALEEPELFVDDLEAFLASTVDRGGSEVRP